MGDLRVRLLGGLVVEGCRPSEVGSRKARTLLAVLAVHGPAPVGLDALVDALWGDDVPAHPADQVGVLVSRLRGTFGADRILRTDAGHRLVADWIDVGELDVRAANARALLHAGDVLGARLAATMALDLARGPLLPEEDGRWVDAGRVRTARTVAAVGLVAAEAALLAGDPLGAAAAAAIGLDHDPYDEAALRALMRAHVAAGRPASGLAAYAEVRRRLAEDLGVSPSSETEALHQRVLGAEPAAGVPQVDRWDPLVQRARAELASFDVVAARRDAEEAVRRGGGPGALELAGWVAYYQRDFATALRWAEAAAGRTEEDERRASCLTLAGRVRHSTGDLSGAEAHLLEAAASPVAGVRAMAEVWLGALRVHQGRPFDALALVDRGAIDAAALRHPFVLPHSMTARVYALGQQGRLADLLRALDGWDRTIEDLGQIGERFRPVVANFRGWALAAMGRRAEAEELNLAAHEAASSFEEPKAHALLDLAGLRLDVGDAAGATSWLERLTIPDDDTAGTMIWHQRQRVGLLRARLALRVGDPTRAEHEAVCVERDAARRGSERARAQAAMLVLQARVAQGHQPLDTEIDSVLVRLDEVAGLEAWRATGELAAAADSEPLWGAARRRADGLAHRAGAAASEVARWTDGELDRLRLRARGPGG